MWAGGNRRLEWASGSVFTHPNKTMFTHNKEYAPMKEWKKEISIPFLIGISTQRHTLQT